MHEGCLCLPGICCCSGMPPCPSPYWLFDMYLSVHACMKSVCVFLRSVVQECCLGLSPYVIWSMCGLCWFGSLIFWYPQITQRDKGEICPCLPTTLAWGRLSYSPGCVWDSVTSLLAACGYYFGLKCMVTIFVFASTGENKWSKNNKVQYNFNKIP